MGSERLPLRQSGIYCNLPTFDPTVTGLSAIVCGASGISGFNTLRALLDDEKRWDTIFTISRKPLSNDALKFLTPSQQSRLRHVSIDLSSSAHDIAGTLRQANVQADYVFFYSYLQPESDKSGMSVDMAEALVETNVPLFRNFLHALPLATLTPKRILLQTGGKNYGMHIGRVRTPLVESDPQPLHIQKIFYYQQEDLLLEYCKAYPKTQWNVIRPAGIIGAAPNIAMNMMYPFAVYAAVQAHKNEPLYFGGDYEAWQFAVLHSSARLTGYLSEWAVMEDRCANQAFNAQDGGPISWDRFFHELARWYGVQKGVVGPTSEMGKYQTITMAGGQDAPLGYGPPLTTKRSFTLADWARDSPNAKAWEDIMQSHSAVKGPKLQRNPFQENIVEVFSGDFAYLNFGVLSQNKVRKFGFSGFVDSLESIFEAYNEMAMLGMLPAMRVEEAVAMV